MKKFKVMFYKLVIAVILITITVNALFPWDDTPSSRSAPAGANIDVSSAAPRPSQNTVILKAKPWNNGYVHIWHTLVELEATHTDVLDGTRCQRLDNKTHQLIGPPPPIYYYHVICNGIAGYVEIDQVR